MLTSLTFTILKTKMCSFEFYCHYPPMLHLLHFLDHYKKVWLSNYDRVSPLCYSRYGDDIFLVFNLHDEAKQFFSYLNSRHPNVKFTMETETNKVIPFLDVVIDNRNNILNTTTYHKSTYSGLLLKFDNFTSRFYKISLIKCLIDCASFLPFLIDNITNLYLEKVNSNSDQSNPESFYKLPYVGKYY